jgi:integrase
VASYSSRTSAKGVITYQVRWRENGENKSIEAPDLRAAKMLKGMVEAHGGTLPPQYASTSLAVPTLAEWFAHYVEHLTAVSERTRDDYRGQFARHIEPTLGELPTNAVSADAVKRWVNRTAPTMAGKTLRNVHGLLSACMAEAVIAGHADANPCRGVRLPRNDDHERSGAQFLSPAEFETVLAEVPEHWRPAFLLLAGTGLRLGEALALTVADVDLLASPPVVRVTKALRYRAGHGYATGPTKTKRSRRTVTLPANVVEALIPLVTRPAYESLLVGPTGKPVYPTNLYARVWKPAVDRCRAREFAPLTKQPRIHDLRHSHASWLVAAGTPLPVVQARLGHESITTTIDTYGHLMPAQTVEAAAAVERAMAGKP